MKKSLYVSFPQNWYIRAETIQDIFRHKSRHDLIHESANRPNTVLTGVAFTDPVFRFKGLLWYPDFRISPIYILVRGPQKLTDAITDDLPGEGYRRMEHRNTLMEVRPTCITRKDIGGVSENPFPQKHTVGTIR